MIKINNKTIERFLLIGYTLLIYFSWLLTSNKIVGFSYFNQVIMMMFIFLVMLNFFFFESKIRFRSIIVVWFPLIVLILLNLVFRERQGITTFIQILSSVLVLFVISNDRKSTNVVLKLALFLSIVFTGFLYLELISPSIYFGLMGKLLVTEDFQTVVTFYNRGVFSGFTNQPGHMAGYCVLGLTILYGYKSKINHLSIYYILTVFFFVALVLTSKRAHTAFYFISLLFTYILFSRNKFKSFLLSFCIVVFTITIFYFLGEYFSSTSSLGRIYESFVGLSNGGDIDSGRAEIYLSAIELFRSSPLFGIGWGNFYFNDLNSTNYIVHNVYIQILTEIGILGLSFFIFPLVFLLVKTINLLNKIGQKEYYNRNMEEIGWLRVSFLIQLFFILYCFTGNPLYNLDYLGMYFLSIFLLVKSCNSIEVYN